MAEKQALNATMFTFRKRERGGVLTGATIAYIVLFILMFAAFAALNWQGVQDYAAWTASFAQNAGAAYDPSAPVNTPPASVIALFPAYFLLMFVYYLLFAAYEAACLKWMIHGEVSGPFGISLGADTWRVWAGYWLWFLLFVGAYIGFFIVALIFMGSMFAIGPTADASIAGSLVLIVPFIVLLALVLIVYFAVRFAPAAATSIARRRFSFFQAWTVTKGRFWELLGSYVLLFIMYFVAVIIACVGIVFAITMSTGSTLQSGASSEEAMAAVFSSPSTIAPVAALYLLMLVAAFVWILMMFGVNARAAALALEEGKISPAT